MSPASTNLSAFSASFGSLPALNTRAQSPRRRSSAVSWKRFGAAAIIFTSTFTAALTSADCSKATDEGICTAPRMAATSLKDIKGLKAIDGSAIPDNTFNGKVVVAVNVASACGYTASGYEMMKHVGEIDNVVVVAVPCNSFGMQENGTPAEIKSFGEARVPDLIMTERSEVNGANAHPIFKLAQSKLEGVVSWNFDGVYVFDRNGVPNARFGNKASPSTVKAAIEKLL